MSELPAGWSTTTVGQVIVALEPGFACGEKSVPSGLNHLRMNNISVDGSLDLELVRTVQTNLAKDRHLLRKGDVLVCTTNSGKLVGKCAVFDMNGDFAFSNHLTRLRPNTEAVHGSFLMWSIWYKWRHGAFEDKCKHWVNQSTIPKEALAALEVVLPPLCEQHRIVEQIETCRQRIESCQQRLERFPILLKRFRQSVLAAAFSGKLTEDWRAANSPGDSAQQYLEAIVEKRGGIKKAVSVPRFGDQEQPSIPESWLWTTADVTCSQITDGEHIQPPYQNSGLPMLSAKHVRDGFVTFEGAGLIAKKDFEKAAKRCSPQNGDLLIVSVGATTGRAALVDGCSPFVIVRSVLLLKPIMSRQYLLRWIQSPWCFEWMTKASGASAQPHLYIGDVKQMPIPIPPPLELIEIERRLEELLQLANQIEARYLTAKVQVDKLTPAILAKAFRGELVPQDPNDEPAEKLLERIRAAKEVKQGSRATSKDGKSGRPKPRKKVAFTKK